MKIRNGFVSNSSSASFVLLLNETKEDFFKKIESELYSYLNFKEIEKEISTTIKQYNISALKKEEIHPNLIEAIQKNREFYLNKLDKIIRACKNEDSEKVLDLYYNIGVFQSNNNLKICGSTIMFNDFCDVPSILRAISSLYLFTDPSKIIKSEIINES